MKKTGKRLLVSSLILVAVVLTGFSGYMLVKNAKIAAQMQAHEMNFSFQGEKQYLSSQSSPIRFKKGENKGTGVFFFGLAKEERPDLYTFNISFTFDGDAGAYFDVTSLRTVVVEEGAKNLEIFSSLQDPEEQEGCTVSKRDTSFEVLTYLRKDIIRSFEVEITIKSGMESMLQGNNNLFKDLCESSLLVVNFAS